MDFDWSAIDEIVWPSWRRPLMLVDRFMRNIWLLEPDMEQAEFGCNIKFEVGAFIPREDSNTDELLRLGILAPADVAGTRRTDRIVGLKVSPVEYDCFDKPAPE